jgi:hypothetical protein
MNSTACLIGLCYMGIIWGQCIGNHLFALEGTLARQTRKCPIVECTQQPLPFLVENPQRPRVHDWTRSVKTTSVWPVIQRAYDALFFRGYFVPLTLVSAREVCFSDFVRVRVCVSERAPLLMSLCERESVRTSWSWLSHYPVIIFLEAQLSSCQQQPVTHAHREVVL